MTLKRNLSVAVVLCAAGPLSAATLLGPSDAIYAIDQDVGAAPTSPAAESVEKLIDGSSGTKFLTGGNNWSGFIVTPGSSVVQSIGFTTANDSESRDPGYYVIYGTTDPITSATWSQGRTENWTQISSGSLSLPSTRLDSSTLASFANGTAYTSYKVLFPKLKGNDSNMQLADIQFYSGSGGTGSSILSPANPIIPVDDTGAGGSSRNPTAESPAKLPDGDTATKYLNFGKENAGFMVTPDIGATVVSGIELWTANDFAGRDPAGFELYGFNDELLFGENGLGEEAAWELIDSGTIVSPDDRLAGRSSRRTIGSPRPGSSRSTTPTRMSPTSSSLRP